MKMRNPIMLKMKKKMELTMPKKNWISTRSHLIWYLLLHVLTLHFAGYIDCAPFFPLNVPNIILSRFQAEEHSEIYLQAQACILIPCRSWPFF